VHVGTKIYYILTYPPYKNGQQVDHSDKRITIGDSDSRTSGSYRVEIYDENRDSSARGLNGRKLALLKEAYESLNKVAYYRVFASKKPAAKVVFTTGLLTVPFKIRPKIDSVNWDMTTDVTIGSYLGFGWRINHYKPQYITFPISAGLTFVNLKNNTTSNTDGPDLVPGITVATGIIFQLDNFNFGGVVGCDWAPGNDWIHHRMPLWFSFSIGHTFLTSNSKDKQQTTTVR
jgi:hypothetical protein